MSITTCIAPVNIAVIKYWGKRDEKLILPMNDSLSTTLSTREMRATTSIMRSPDFTENRLWLNGREESFDNPRLRRCLQEIRNLAKAVGDTPETDWKVHVCSENNFPTAAGLASSAAGYACLVYALARVFGVEGDVSGVARQGSGSACRSLAGGFVCWARGLRDDGLDSTATQLFPADHWPSLRILILVVTEKKKKVSSTIGMQRSVDTSDLLNHRTRCCVPERIQFIREAIAEKDFENFGIITMRESNQFHAIALDTYPPAVYMNDTSHSISELVHAYNDVRGQVKVAYTFDAGPNACLYVEEGDVAEVAALVKHVFPPVPSSENEFFTGKPLTVPPLSQELKERFPPNEPGLLQYTILTELGSGPEQLTDPSSHLLTDDGLPKNLKSKSCFGELGVALRSDLTELGLESELKDHGTPKKVHKFSPDEPWLMQPRDLPQQGPSGNGQSEDSFRKLLKDSFVPEDLDQSKHRIRIKLETGPDEISEASMDEPTEEGSSKM